MIIECAECHQRVEAGEVGSYWSHFDDREESCRYTLLVCTACSAPILVRQTSIGDPVEGDEWGTPQVVFPQNNIRVNPNASPEIRAAFDEASACYRTQAFTAAAMMCRTALEGACSAHGVEEGNLSASLRKMRDVGLIDECLFVWSEALRVVVHEVTCGAGSQVTQADARDALEFTNAILDYLFSYRDRFEQFQKRRRAVPTVSNGRT